MKATGRQLRGTCIVLAAIIAVGACCPTPTTTPQSEPKSVLPRPGVIIEVVVGGGVVTYYRTASPKQQLTLNTSPDKLNADCFGRVENWLVLKSSSKDLVYPGFPGKMTVQLDGAGSYDIDVDKDGNVTWTCWDKTHTTSTPLKPGTGADGGYPPCMDGTIASSTFTFDPSGVNFSGDWISLAYAP